MVLVNDMASDTRIAPDLVPDVPLAAAAIVAVDVDPAPAPAMT